MTDYSVRSDSSIYYVTHLPAERNMIGSGSMRIHKKSFLFFVTDPAGQKAEALKAAVTLTLNEYGRTDT